MRTLDQKRASKPFLAIPIVAFLSGCVLAPNYTNAEATPQQCGIASFYGWEAGTHTANGERWNPNGMTAAHKTWAFGLMIRVTRTDTGQSVVVRLNDRGPFIPGRIIDLSRAAAEAIDMIRPGVVPVCITILN